MTMKHLFLLLLSLLLCTSGCGTIYHTRDVLDTKGNVVAREAEGGRAFLMKSALDKLSSKTKDGDYQHSFSASGVDVSGDVEMVKELRGFMKDAAAMKP